ncbi:hypothetical protein HAV15_003077 [Penicillium sp. str. |nr:hypothetical protein HAV15_003077 [Penicillium sp. str. \
MAPRNVLLIGLVPTALLHSLYYIKVLQGANRDLGLGLLKVFKEQGYNVFGTIRPQTRSDPSFEDLKSTGATIIDLDYLEEDSIAAAAESYGNDQALDVLGPFLASKYFLPSLKKSEFGNIVNITSEWASIAANDCGTHISYRVPKSALNALSISVAIELKAAKENIAVLCIDPGDVPTKLSRWAGDIDLNDSVHGMFEQIERATIEDTGLFLFVAVDCSVTMASTEGTPTLFGRESWPPHERLYELLFQPPTSDLPVCNYNVIQVFAVQNRGAIYCIVE